jgi:hypothetical protein
MRVVQPSLVILFVILSLQGIYLYIDLVLPDLLLRSSRVLANVQQRLHLFVTDEKDITRHEEPDTFGAWRSRQGACEVTSAPTLTLCRSKTYRHTSTHGQSG